MHVSFGIEFMKLLTKFLKSVVGLLHVLFGSVTPPENRSSFICFRVLSPASPSASFRRAMMRRALCPNLASLKAIDLAVFKS